MPLIRINSLPFKNAIDIPKVVEAFSSEFSADMRIDIKHISVVWQFIQAGHYAVGGKTQKTQPTNSHPILVEILTPDSYHRKTIEKMFKITSTRLAALTMLPTSNIFIHHKSVASGNVFENNKIVLW